MTSLVIIRTPFQAFLATKIIKVENIKSYDLIYFTQNDSEEDKYYYKLLSEKSSTSNYYYLKLQKPSILSSILFKLITRKWYSNKKYYSILCSSIDALFITSLIKHYSEAQLITFDDGTANINTESSYFKERNNLRLKVYRHLLNSLTLNEIKSRINRHYTVYNDMQNIVPQNKIKPLSDILSIDSKKEESHSTTYFIGSPFEEDMTQRQITRLASFVRNLEIDFYVKHPREKQKLGINAPDLNKSGKIAEEAILESAYDTNIVLIGGFSSVLFNMGDLCQKRIVILAKDSEITEKLAKLSKSAGCEVVLV